MKNRYGLLLALLLMAVGFSQFSQAQAKENIDPSKLPTLLGGSNAGTDFWFSFPVCWAQSGEGNALKIYVSAGSAVQCTLEIPGLGKRLVKTTKPNDVIEFTIFPGEGQPYEKNDNPSTAKTEEETWQDGKGRGVHVTAPVPIIVYGVSRFVYTSDSFLALPTSALGKEYIVASYADVTAPFAGQHLMSQTVIVAAYDNTVVTFKLGGSYGTKTVGGMTRGQTKRFTLHKGDLVAFANKKLSGTSVYFDLSGSKITSTKPVAVTSGNQCAYVDVATPACDFIMEMELPTNTWGKEYHVTRFVKRKNYSFMKIFAKNPNTKVFRDGNPVAFTTLSTAGGLENAGYYQGRVLDDGLAPRPIVIKADGPISVTMYNCGQSDDGVQSDPFQLVLTPIEQYQKEIIFNTPGIRGGQGFKENYVNLVFEGNPDGSMPDDLEFAVVDNGKFVWKVIKSVFGATSEPFKSFPGDTRKFYSKIITLPGDGVYKIRAQKPFAAYAYGFDNYDSYGHPTSVALGDLDLKDVVKPRPTYTQLCDGSVTGKVTDMPDSIEVRSNLSLITLLDGSSNYLLTKDDFVPGDVRTANWSLKVEDPTQDALANVYFSDRAGNDTTVTITYLAPAVKFDATSLNYGLLKTNDPKVMQLVVRNTSTVAPQVITDIKIKGEGTSGFTFVTTPVTPITIQPEKTESFPIQFVSAVEGNDFKDSVIVEINGCTKIGAELLASVGEPVIEVTDIPFGVMPAGKSDTRSLTVRNTGKVDLILSGVSGNKLPNEFTLSGNGWNITPASTITLVPGASQDLDVTFKSNVVGNYVDTVFFASNATKVKNYSVLTAATIQGNLGAVGYPWPRKRINKTYNDGFIVLRNFGNAPVTIRESKLIGADASVFGVKPYGTVTIQGGEADTIRNVTFTPNRTGSFAAQVEFTTTDDAVVTADLTGFGITGIVAITPVVNFGSTLVNSATSQKRTVWLSAVTDNLPLNQSIYDSVTVSDLIVGATGGAISPTLGAVGTEGFGYDKASLNLAVTLQPGDSIEIPAEFIAKRAGAATATLTTESDADNDVEPTSTWSGAGLTEGIIPSSTTGTFCINQNGTITVTLNNPNNTDATVTNVEVTNASTGATFTAVAPLNFTVPANDGTKDGVHTITFNVSSSVVGINTATIRITGSSETTQDVTFTTVDYTRTASMSRGLKVDVGSQIGASIKLENGAAFALAEVHKLNIAFSYNPTLVQIDKSTIATAVPGFAITNLDVKPTLGTVTLSLESTSPTNSLPRTGELELVSWKFDAFLNGQPIDSMEINQTVTVADNSCLKIQSKPGFLTVNPVCGGDVRRINVSGISYAMSISPNPAVSGQPVEITFSVGLDNTYTIIEVTNTMGVVVATLVKQTLEKGDYAISLNTHDMASGMYFYRIVSGPYTDTKKMLISK
ncbi:MAG: choice-of-anchor D domain-containing protein [Bacteroidota bacterium]